MPRLLARMIKEVGDIPGTIFAGGHNGGAPFYILGDGNPPILEGLRSRGLGIQILRFRVQGLGSRV